MKKFVALVSAVLALASIGCDREDDGPSVTQWLDQPGGREIVRFVAEVRNGQEINSYWLRLGAREEEIQPTSQTAAGLGFNNPGPMVADMAGALVYVDPEHTLHIGEQTVPNVEGGFVVSSGQNPACWSGNEKHSRCSPERTTVLMTGQPPVYVVKRPIQALSESPTSRTIYWGTEAVSTAYNEIAYLGFVGREAARRKPIWIGDTSKTTVGSTEKLTVTSYQIGVWGGAVVPITCTDLKDQGIAVAEAPHYFGRSVRWDKALEITKAKPGRLIASDPLVVSICGNLHLGFATHEQTCTQEATGRVCIERSVFHLGKTEIPLPVAAN